MTLPDAVYIARQVMSSPVGDEVVLLDVEAGIYYGLDAVGARVWELLAGGCRPTQVLETVLAEFDVEREVLETDLHALLADLERHHLIAFSA